MLFIDANLGSSAGTAWGLKSCHKWQPNQLSSVGRASPQFVIRGMLVFSHVAMNIFTSPAEDIRKNDYVRTWFGCSQNTTTREKIGVVRIRPADSLWYERKAGGELAPRRTPSLRFGNLRLGDRQRSYRFHSGPRKDIETKRNTICSTGWVPDYDPKVDLRGIFHTLRVHIVMERYSMQTRLWKRRRSSTAW